MSAKAKSEPKAETVETFVPATPPKLDVPQVGEVRNQEVKLLSGKTKTIKVRVIKSRSKKIEE